MHRTRSEHLALQIIPPLKTKQEKQEQQIVLEAAMQSLVLDKRHPVALELAGTAERRSFIVRATSQIALDHIEMLLRSQYPQLEVRQLREHEDPFRLKPNEAVSALELVAGTASYLPLRTWKEPRTEQEETDPILGLLAALSKLPEGVRAVTQIALVPAKANWSHRHLRKAIEDALDPEKESKMLEMAQARDANQSINWAVAKTPWESVSTPVILILGMLLGLYVLARPWIPDWVGEAIWKAMRGQNPQFTPDQFFWLGSVTVGLTLVSILLYVLINQARQLINPTLIYDKQLVAEKTSRMAYRARLRLYVIGPQVADDTLLQSASSREQRSALRTQTAIRQNSLLRLVAAYRQFHMASGAYFVPRKISVGKSLRLLSRDLSKSGRGWQRGLSFSRHLISVDALAMLWHMPSSTILSDIPLVDHRRSRTLLISPDLAQHSEGLPPVGYSEHGGYRLPFGLNGQFFQLHTLIGGKSGEGKSTFMEHIAREAMSDGGLVLIDPHGDLAENVLRVVPPHRTDDVVLIDLSERDGSVGINPLDVTLGRNRDKAISDLLKTMSHIWIDAWGPRMENAFEMALRTLFEANRAIVTRDPQEGPLMQYTILDVLPVLTNENFCHALLQEVQDDYLHRWWREYYEPMTLMQQREVVIPVLSKVTKFEGILARRILGQGTATIDFTRLVAERKIILLKLAKGVVGADVAAIIGATLLGLIQLTLEEQGNKHLQDRVRLPIIIDEFQTMAGADYASLAELRKYGATFFLATQSLEYLQKLDPVLLPLILANVKQLAIFHMSAQDAEVLCEELGVEAEDISNLDMYTCYMKLAAGQRRQSTFSLKVAPPPSGDSTQAESIRVRSRVRYTCSNDVVDERLRAAMIRTLRLAPAPTPNKKKKRVSPQPTPAATSVPTHQPVSPPTTSISASLSPSIASTIVEEAPILLPPARSIPVVTTEPEPEAPSILAITSLPEPETSIEEDDEPSDPDTDVQTEESQEKRRRRGRRGGKRVNKNKKETTLDLTDASRLAETD